MNERLILQGSAKTATITLRFTVACTEKVVQVFLVKNELSRVIQHKEAVGHKI